MRIVTLHKAAAFAVLTLTVALLGFTGYSYAIGSNPVSVLKRWVSGSQVQVEYNGHTYNYGNTLSYSDAAVTAFAELNTVSSLYSQGNNFFTVPKDGIEYLTGSVDAADYAYPWVGTVTQVTDGSLVVRKQFVTGDKMNQVQDTDETVTLPLSDTSYVMQGNPTTASAAAVGKVVEVYQRPYIKHYIGTARPVGTVTHYFAYQLTHSVDDIKQAEQQPPSYSNPAAQPIQDYAFGITDGQYRCYNNSADICRHQTRNGDGSQSLFGNSVDPSTGKDYGPENNPAVVNFGAGSPAGMSKTLIIRDTEGVVTAVTPTSFTIKTSSGAQWTFMYSTTLQQAFSAEFSPLQTRDHISASIVAPLHSLDARTIDTAHIYQLVRFKV